MTCSACNQKAKDVTVSTFISSKLGVCKQCMVTSFIGTIIGWSMVMLIYFVQFNPVLFFILTFAAGSFTFMLVAHFIAYFKKKSIASKSNK
jgi:zinc transporter ZupT